MDRRKGTSKLFYSTNYLIDVDNNVIMDVQASPSTQKLEVDTTQTMIERVEVNHRIRPDRLMGDTAYGAADNLAYLVDEKQIEPHVPVFEKINRKDGTFSRCDFEWNADADEYRCPAGKLLRPRRRNHKGRGSPVTKANTIIYRASMKDCRLCPMKQRCCPNMGFRKITHSIHEAARDVARTITGSARYLEVSTRQRKKVEMLFAHMKRHLGFDRLRLRGLHGANDEFLLVATAQNLRKLAKHLSQPPPGCGVSAPAILKMA
jgi:hypothetical protein